MQQQINSDKFNYQLSYLRLSAFVFSCIFLGFSVNFAQDETKILPPQNFHQWGAVTIFNGLPSDSVRAISQTEDGILWFGTENGLARFDGRRVQNIPLENVSKILTLKISPDAKTLWIGTDNGAFVYRAENFRKIESTENFSINAILFTENIYLATENGLILKLSETAPNNFQTEKIESQLLFGNDGKPLKTTSLAQTADGKIIVGTQSRGILLIENNQVSQIPMRPRPFFVNALTQGVNGKIFIGAKDRKSVV